MTNHMIKDVSWSIYILDHLTCLFYTQGVDGPSSVFVSVICDRKRTADPVRTATWYLQRANNAYPPNPNITHKHFFPYIS